jgi:hypothetical protein
VGKRSGDQVGEDGFNDGVLAMGDVSVSDRFGRVGEKRVISPDGEQCIGPAGVFDAADDQPGGDWLAGGGERGVGVSATSASEIHCPVSGSWTAPG